MGKKVLRRLLVGQQNSPENCCFPFDEKNGQKQVSYTLLLKKTAGSSKHVFV